MIQRPSLEKPATNVVIEEFLDGIELSVFVLTDGKDYIFIPKQKITKELAKAIQVLIPAVWAALARYLLRMMRLCIKW